ncbi:helix-turn-helix domain-containing protein [Zooshikella ganghwensis]|uniref:XRE family transcriptional regulator n=1 Tax=Zooshikella ganghwensis TaxID=202772 RepID=A0A4P9VGS1_9GAMM|nr:helix-turn-helix transcriptional regulator [Zooshikella ganghwensis]RDH41626.1 XRE family transcriptional regulator [Zooshikella ganghwensis]
MEVIKKIFDSINVTLKDRGITLVELSRISRIPKTTLYRHFEQQEKLTLGELEAICKALKIQPLCLAITPDEIRLLDAYRAHNRDAQRNALGLLESTTNIAT